MGNLLPLVFLHEPRLDFEYDMLEYVRGKCSSRDCGTVNIVGVF